MSPRSDNGYKMINLYLNAKVIGRAVHILVAESFLPKPPGENLVVDHKNQVRDDNRVENLEWVTGQQNTERACGVPVSQYSLTGEWLKDFNSMSEACKFLDLDYRKAYGSFRKGKPIDDYVLKVKACE